MSMPYPQILVYAKRISNKQSSLFVQSVNDEENWYYRVSPGEEVIKLFTVVNYECSSQGRVIVLGKPIKPGLVFESKAGVYPCGPPIKCSSLGYAPCLTHYWSTYHVFLTNIRTCRRCLLGTNTLAYFKHFLIMTVKSFITLMPLANVIKLFTALSYEFP
jgi:hypothetical protein